MNKKDRQDKILKDIKNLRHDVTVLSEYQTMKKPIKLRCMCGWEYEQPPAKLLAGQKGCPICGNASNDNQNTETFKKRAENVHGDFYDYSKSTYTKGSEKLVITCPVHGDFEQRPTNHLKMKQGCPKCGTENRKHYIGWTYTEWEKTGKNSKNFSGFKLYKVRCFDTNTGEEFIKIGKTFTNVANRFLTVPYDYEILEIKEGSARFISDLEVELQTILKNEKYTPSKKFCGMTECFTMNKE